MNALHSFLVVYDRAVLLRGVTSFFWRRGVLGLGWLGFAAIALILVSFFAADTPGWVQYLGLSAIGLWVLVVALAWGGNLHLRMSRFKSMTDPKVRFDFFEGHFDVSSVLGNASTPWERLKGIIALKDCWILFGDRADFIILPVQGVPKEALNFLTLKITGREYVPA